VQRAGGAVTLAVEPLIDALETWKEGDALKRLAGLPGVTYPALARRAYFRATGQELEAEPRGYPRSRFLQNSATGRVTIDFLHEKGLIRMALDADAAPENVATVVSLARRGYYRGLDWHRVEPNFVIQGGDPRFDGWGDPGYRVLDEISALPHTRGAVGISKMAKDTGDSQIYVTHVPTPHLDGRYTVIGYVIEGLDVLDRIEVGDRILGVAVREP
jgi:cyclophilin family peptidyl-prolyl cis-trans isomerase